MAIKKLANQFVTGLKVIASDPLGAVSKVTGAFKKVGDAIKQPWTEEKEQKALEAETKQREQFESDRAHAEEREDSAIQRAIKDSQLAGVSPVQSGAIQRGGGSSAPSYEPTEPEDETGLVEILRAFIPIAYIMLRKKPPKS